MLIHAAHVDVKKDNGTKVGTENILLALVEEECGVMAKLAQSMKQLAHASAVAKAIAEVTEKK